MRRSCSDADVRFTSSVFSLVQGFQQEDKEISGALLVLLQLRMTLVTGDVVDAEVVDPVELCGC